MNSENEVLLAVLVCVVLSGLSRMMRRVEMMPVRDVCVMSRFLVAAGFVMLRGLFVMLGGVPMVLRRLPMVLRTFVRHGCTSPS